MWRPLLSCGRASGLQRPCWGCAGTGSPQRLGERRQRAATACRAAPTGLEVPGMGEHVGSEFEVIVIGQLFTGLDVSARDDKHATSGRELRFTVALTAMINALGGAAIDRRINKGPIVDTKQEDHPSWVAGPAAISLSSRDALTRIFNNPRALCNVAGGKPAQPGNRRSFHNQQFRKCSHTAPFLCSEYPPRWMHTCLSVAAVLAVVNRSERI